MQNTQTFSSLNSEQKEAIGLLSIGTFLEYFDLMLYVHMAVLLNEIFFPATDPFTASLLSAFAFCSTFVFRPVGALILGWLGDNIGRKSTVVITTMTMALSCFIMATLPPYAQIGITAAWLFTLCRILQGMSSMGEIIGAILYLVEITKPPVQYPIVVCVSIFQTFGATFALAIASLVTSEGYNWRYAFWFGGGVAIIGAIARTRLRETPDFVDAKRRILSKYKKAGINSHELEKDPVYKTKVDKLTLLALFFMDCAWPICFYFTYIYCGNVLKTSFGLSSEQVINQNFIVSLLQLFATIILGALSYRIYPLKLVKYKLMLFVFALALCPSLLISAKGQWDIFVIQLLIILFACDQVPAAPIFLKYFPVFKRFTTWSLSYALSRALMHIINSFGLVYLTSYFGHYGVLFLAMPITIGYTFGVLYFDKAEKESGSYPVNPKKNSHLLQDQG